MSEAVLKPCPFCGSTPNKMSVMGEVWIICKCKASGPMVDDCSEQQQIDKWNTRHENLTKDDGDYLRQRIAEAACMESKISLLYTAIKSAIQALGNVEDQDGINCLSILHEALRHE